MLSPKCWPSEPSKKLLTASTQTTNAGTDAVVIVIKMSNHLDVVAEFHHALVPMKMPLNRLVKLRPLLVKPFVKLRPWLRLVKPFAHLHGLRSPRLLWKKLTVVRLRLITPTRFQVQNILPRNNRLMKRLLPKNNLPFRNNLLLVGE
jgi:hypothetical protein